MAALSDADKMHLKGVHQRYLDSDKGDILCAGRNLADVMRSALPDITDVTIGRVCLTIQEYLGSAMADVTCERMDLASAFVICAGLDLTSAEWQEAGDVA